MLVPSLLGQETVTRQAIIKKQVIKVSAPKEPGVQITEVLPAVLPTPTGVKLCVTPLLNCEKHFADEMIELMKDKAPNEFKDVVTDALIGKCVPFDESLCSETTQLDYTLDSKEWNDYQNDLKDENETMIYNQIMKFIAKENNYMYQNLHNLKDQINKTDAEMRMEQSWPHHEKTLKLFESLTTEGRELSQKEIMDLYLFDIIFEQKDRGQ